MPIDGSMIAIALGEALIVVGLVGFLCANR